MFPQPSLLSNIRGVLFMGIIAVSYLILVPPVQLWLWIKKRKRSMATLGHWYFSKLLPLCRIEPTVVGQENIPRDRAFMVLSNHQSFLDIGSLMVFINPLAFLAKKELFKVPLFGNSLEFMGSIPVDRNNRHGNAELPSQIQSMVAKGYCYCVFPEGTRSPDGKLLPFKKGVFHIIHQAPILVLPVTIDGTCKVMPKKGLHLFLGYHPRIVIHKPIEAEAIAKMSRDELLQSVRSSIAQGFDPPQ